MFHLKQPTFSLAEARATFEMRGGHLYWKKGKYAGKKAGWKDRLGYWCVQFKRESWKVHRVVWFISTGGWPRTTMDHVDGNLDNNSVDNLREAPPEINSKNRRIRTDNTTGTTGYSVLRVRKTWAAHWSENKKHRQKTFYTEAEARAFVLATGKGNVIKTNQPNRPHTVRWSPSVGVVKRQSFATKDEALRFLDHIEKTVKLQQGYTTRHGK